MFLDCAYRKIIPRGEVIHPPQFCAFEGKLLCTKCSTGPHITLISIVLKRMRCPLSDTTI